MVRMRVGGVLVLAAVVSFWGVPDVTLADHEEPTIRFGLSLSGGGLRAAAFAYGVMLGLDEVQLCGVRRSLDEKHIVELDRVELRSQSTSSGCGTEKAPSLLDELNFISAVSGGTLPASYYIARPKQVFKKEFRTSLTNHSVAFDLAGSVKARITTEWFGELPLAPLLLLTSVFDTVKDLVLLPFDKLPSPRLPVANPDLTPLTMLGLSEGLIKPEDLAESYRAWFFNGETITLGDAQHRKKRTKLLINATDVKNGRLFTFDERTFECMGIRDQFRTFPLDLAAAASSALPVVFSPVSLDNYLEKGSPASIPADCGAPEWGRGAHRRPMLLDGGVIDNLGIGSLVRKVFQEKNDPKNPGALQTRAFLISVNASAADAAGFRSIGQGASLAENLDQSFDVLMTDKTDLSRTVYQQALSNFGFELLEIRFSDIVNDPRVLRRLVQEQLKLGSASSEELERATEQVTQFRQIEERMLQELNSITMLPDARQVDLLIMTGRAYVAEHMEDIKSRLDRLNRQQFKDQCEQMINPARFYCWPETFRTPHLLDRPVRAILVEFFRNTEAFLKKTTENRLKSLVRVRELDRVDAAEEDKLDRKFFAVPLLKKVENGDWAERDEQLYELLREDDRKQGAEKFKKASVKIIGSVKELIGELDKLNDELDKLNDELDKLNDELEKMEPCAKPKVEKNSQPEKKSNESQESRQQDPCAKRDMLLNKRDMLLKQWDKLLARIADKLDAESSLCEKSCMPRETGAEQSDKKDEPTVQDWQDFRRSPWYYFLQVYLNVGDLRKKERLHFLHEGLARFPEDMNLHQLAGLQYAWEDQSFQTGLDHLKRAVYISQTYKGRLEAVGLTVPDLIDIYDKQKERFERAVFKFKYLWALTAAISQQDVPDEKDRINEEEVTSWLKAHYSDGRGGTLVRPDVVKAVVWREKPRGGETEQLVAPKVQVEGQSSSEVPLSHLLNQYRKIGCKLEKSDGLWELPPDQDSAASGQVQDDVKELVTAASLNLEEILGLGELKIDLPDGGSEFSVTKAMMQEIIGHLIVSVAVRIGKLQNVGSQVTWLSHLRVDPPRRSCVATGKQPLSVQEKTRKKELSEKITSGIKKEVRRIEEKAKRGEWKEQEIKEYVDRKIQAWAGELVEQAVRGYMKERTEEILEGEVQGIREQVRKILARSAGWKRAERYAHEVYIYSESEDIKALFPELPAMAADTYGLVLLARDSQKECPERQQGIQQALNLFKKLLPEKNKGNNQDNTTVYTDQQAEKDRQKIYRHIAWAEELACSN